MSAPQLAPAERLALSRERLRAGLANHTATRASGGAASGVDLLDILKTALPGANVWIDTLGPALKHWWARHPLHSSGVLASDLARTVLRPMAQRHPMALVTGAVVLGALLAWSRPWRWAFKPRNLLPTLGPALLSSVLASTAVQSWIASLLAKNQEPPVSK